MYVFPALFLLQDAHAQNSGMKDTRLSPAERTELMTRLVSKRLTLSASETEKLKKVNLAFIKELDVLNGEKSLNNLERKLRTDSLETDLDHQYREILNPDEYHRLQNLNIRKDSTSNLTHPQN